MSKVSLQVKGITPAELIKRVEDAAKADVLVGVPESTAQQRQGGNGKINNAMLAAIHEAGAPSRNIPSRPFMAPGIERVKDRLFSLFTAAAESIISGGDTMPYLERIGKDARDSIRGYFTADNGWKPLSAKTIVRRAYNRLADNVSFIRASKQRRFKMLMKEVQRQGFQRPLVDKGDLRRSITYVIEERDK